MGKDRKKEAERQLKIRHKNKKEMEKLKALWAYTERNNPASLKQFLTSYESEQNSSKESEEPKEPSTQEPKSQEPPTQEPPTQEPSTQEPPNQEPPTQEPPTQEPPTQEPLTQEPLNQEPTNLEIPQQLWDELLSYFNDDSLNLDFLSDSDDSFFGSFE
jgi:hypothetical protein